MQPLVALAPTEPLRSSYSRLSLRRSLRRHAGHRGSRRRARRARHRSARARGLEPERLGSRGCRSARDPSAPSRYHRHHDGVLSRATMQDFVLDEADCPILQAIPVGQRERSVGRLLRAGLSAADLAMQIALPEFDGRIAAGPISFKAEEPADPALAFSRPGAGTGCGRHRCRGRSGRRMGASRPHAAAERRLALVLSDYPARGGRAGFAVGLDTPASACAILDRARRKPDTTAGRDFHRRRPDAALTEARLRSPFRLPPIAPGSTALPAERRAAIDGRWGEPEDDPPSADGCLPLPHDPRRKDPRRASARPRPWRSTAKALYHDPDCPPSHGYLAFYLRPARAREHSRARPSRHAWHDRVAARQGGRAVHAMLAAPRDRCASGDLSLHRRRSRRGGSRQAPHRRGHDRPSHAADDRAPAFTARQAPCASSWRNFPPPRCSPGPRRLVAKEIRERAQASGLAAACGVDDAMPMDEALTPSRRPSLRSRRGDDPRRTACLRPGALIGFESLRRRRARGPAERALDGRFVVPGPAGSPSRGQTDVLPTGRNLATLDPRAIPTRAATELG